jgi:hypothetical protein
MTDVSDKHCFDAIDRIARSDDGYMLYLYLQKALCAVGEAETSGRALRANEGRRKFAATLMGLMAKGIRESGRAADPIVTFAVAGARSVAKPGSGTSRIRDYLAGQTDAEPDAKIGSG